MLKVALLGNCQAFPIKETLKANINDLHFIAIPPIHSIIGSRRKIKEIYDSLISCDYIITQPLAERFHELSLQNLREKFPKNLIAIPVIFYQGEHPEMFYLRDQNGTIIKDFVTDYHDMNILISYVNGMPSKFASSLIEKEDLYNVDTINLIKEKSLNTLKDREKSCDIIISDFIEENKHTEDSLFWSINHPSNAILYKLSERIIRLLGFYNVEMKQHNIEYLGKTIVPKYEAGISENDVIYKVGGENYSRENMIKMYYKFYDTLTAEVLDFNMQSLKKSYILSDFFTEMNTKLHPKKFDSKIICKDDFEVDKAKQIPSFQNTIDQYRFEEFTTAEANNENITLQLLFYIQKKKLKELIETIKILMSKDTLILDHPETSVKTTAIYSISNNGLSNFIFFRADDYSNPWILVQKDRFIEAIIVPDKAYVFFMTQKFIKHTFKDLLKEHNVNDIFSKETSSVFRGIVIGDRRPFHYFYDKFRMIKAFENEVLLTGKQIYELSSLSYYSVKDIYPQLDVVVDKEDGVYISPVFAGANTFFQNKISKIYYDLANYMEDALYENAIASYSNELSDIKKTDNSMCIWIGVTGQKRSWHEQIEGYASILNKLMQEYGVLTVIIDGMTATYDQTIHNSDDLYVYDEIASRVNKKIKVINIIGSDYKTKIQYCHFADYFIANAGTGCFVPLRICKKPGVLHSNTRLFTFPDKYPAYVKRTLVEETTDLSNLNSDNSMDISYSIDWEVIYDKLNLVMTEYNKAYTQKGSV